MQDRTGTTNCIAAMFFWSEVAVVRLIGLHLSAIIALTVARIVLLGWKRTRTTTGILIQSVFRMKNNDWFRVRRVFDEIAVPIE